MISHCIRPAAFQTAFWRPKLLTYPAALWLFIKLHTADRQEYSSLGEDENGYDLFCTNGRQLTADENEFVRKMRWSDRDDSLSVQPGYKAYCNIAELRAVPLNSVHLAGTLPEPPADSLTNPNVTPA